MDPTVSGVSGVVRVVVLYDLFDWLDCVLCDCCSTSQCCKLSCDHGMDSDHYSAVLAIFIVVLCLVLSDCQDSGGLQSINCDCEQSDNEQRRRRRRRRR